jgi:uncharacterized protein (DUF58 family)
MKATPEGKRFILVSALIAVAALNTGNNLIYLILALMLSLMCLSLVILKLMLSKISIDVASHAPVFAGEEAAFSVTVKNRKRRIPSYSLSVLSEGMAGAAYLPVVAAQAETVKDVKMFFGRRGLYGAGSFTARSGFPFILFSGEKKMDVAREVLVYPALCDVGDMVPDVWGALEGDAMRMAGAGEEIYSIRDFRQGDDLRRIHWKATAKVADLMVKEYAEHELHRTTILLDNLKNGDLRNNKSLDEVFEKSVTLCASLAKHFIERGHLVRVVSSRKVIPFGSGDEQLFKVLDILATIAEEESWESPLPGEGEGFIVSVLRSSWPSAQGLVAISDLVVNAETL